LTEAKFSNKIKTEFTEAESGRYSVGTAIGIAKIT